MRTKLITTALLAAMLATTCLSGCGSEREPEPPLITPSEVNPNVNIPQLQLACRLHTFSKMVDALDTGENIMMSPLSLNMAMGLVTNACSDNVAASMQNYYGASAEEYNQFVHDYMESLPDYVEIANSLWVNDRFQPTDTIKTIATNQYASDIYTQKFDEALVNSVNAWCSNKTHDKIPVILTNVPEADASAILLNALYFNGRWTKQYTESDIHQEPFTLSDGSEITVDMMYDSLDLYYENEKATAFGKYYEGNRYCFIGILPNQTGDFDLASLNLDSLLQSESHQPVVTGLPKFTFESDMDLKAALAQTEATVLYQENSLDKLVKNHSATVSYIKQKTMIRLDEIGTEAAAITSIACKNASTSPITQEPKEVILNRPFAFIIYDTEAKAPLFIGKVMELGKE